MIDVRTEQVEQLRAEGLTVQQIGKRLGMSRSTVYRILHPEYAERDRRNARAYKRELGETCAACGAPTKYNGHRGTVSERCFRCATTAARDYDHDLIVRLRLTGLTQHEIAVHVGCAQPTVAYVLARRGLTVGRGNRQERVI